MPFQCAGPCRPAVYLPDTPAARVERGLVILTYGNGAEYAFPIESVERTAHRVLAEIFAYRERRAEIIAFPRRAGHAATSAGVD